MSSLGERRRVTVIVPVYNREEQLLCCLDSIAAQDYRPLRIIVTDNASTDRTREAAVEWGALHSAPELEVIVTDEPTRGASAARCKGFEAGFGVAPGECEDEVISFFDSDDVMLPGMLSAVMDIFNREPATEIVAWRMCRRMLDGTTRLSRRVSDAKSVDMHLVHSFLSTLNYAVRAATLRRAGGWRRGMMEWDDWELGVRLLLGSPEIKVIDKALVLVNCQSQSITGVDFSSKAGKWERVLDIVEHTLAESGRKDRARLRRVVAYRRVILAAHYSREGHPELARPLLERALGTPLLSPLRRMMLRGAFHYTALGLRGAYTFLRPFI
ncbi:MAG: glycosyltransferase family 2 protein [Muribaculaceae bacterium]|nr:glycosyltransferase family 2 protein [Muribaculaceae bacterium]